MKASKDSPRSNLTLLHGKRTDEKATPGEAHPDEAPPEEAPPEEAPRTAQDFAFDLDQQGDGEAPARPAEAEASGEAAPPAFSPEPSPLAPPAGAAPAEEAEAPEKERRAGQSDAAQQARRELRAQRRQRNAEARGQEENGEEKAASGKEADERGNDRKRGAERRAKQRAAGKKTGAAMPIPLVKPNKRSRDKEGAKGQLEELRLTPPAEAPAKERRRQPEPEAEPRPVDQVKQGLGMVVGFFKTLLVLALIVGPMLAAGYYYFFVAADRYEVKTVFLIRTAGSETPQVASFLGQTQAFGRAADESFSVVDYVHSYEGLVRLQNLVDLRAAYSLPKDDPFYYLPADSTLLELHDYYLRMVDAVYDQITGLVTIDVRAFTPGDALAISKALLAESERLINEFNSRAQADLLQLSRQEVANALADLERAEGALTVFRQTNNVIDPSEVIIRVNGIIATLEGEIAKAEAELLQLSKVTGNKGGVARLELEARIESLRLQVDRERDRLIGQQESVGTLIPQFELLSLRKELAGQAYSAALASMQNAVAQAQRQQLYVVPVVAPTELDQAQLPDRWESLFFVFLVVLLVFTIGRLLFLGIRDHIL